MSKRPGPRAGNQGRLSREWTDELRDMVRPGRLPEVAALVAKALEAFVKGDYAHAASLASRAKADAQRSGRVRELLGLALYHSSSYREALRELLTYRRLSGKVDQNHVIADCYRATGRPDRALEICFEVTRGRVDAGVWAEVLIVSASALADQGDFERALGQLARGDLSPAKVEPQHLRLWYVRGDILEKAGRAKEALKVWERIVAEDPRFFDAAERLTGSNT